MKFCIRTDDLGWTAEESAPPPLKRPDIGLRAAQRFHAAMQGVSYLGAVIPTCVDVDGTAWLRSAPKGLTVALHGWNHRMAADGVASEFRGMTQDDLRNRLAQGMEALGMSMRHFVPPFNAIEPVMAEACYLEGIRYIWAGGAHDMTAPSAASSPPLRYSLGRMTFVPSWAPLYGATLWRMNADTPALFTTLPQVIDQPGVAVLTLHVPWEMAHSPTFDGVREFVDRYGDHVISPQEYLEMPR